MLFARGSARAVVFVFALSLIGVLIGSSASAMGTGGEKASTKVLRIVEVFIDFDVEEIEIVVENLGSGPGPLVVRLGDAGNFGDITGLCSEDFVSMPQVVTCDFSALGLPADGDYLLTVQTGKASTKEKASTKREGVDEVSRF